MRWTRVEQQEKYYSLCKTGGVLYKDHLVILKDQLDSEENTLCCLNLRINSFESFPFIISSDTKNTWSTFDIQGMDVLCSVDTNNLMVYNGLLLAFATETNGEDFILAALNLESTSYTLLFCNHILD